MQSIIITRMIVGMLALPLGLILGAIFAVMLTIWALTVHPLLALAVIVAGVLLLLAAAKWESNRLARNASKDDEV